MERGTTVGPAARPPARPRGRRRYQLPPGSGPSSILLLVPRRSSSPGPASSSDGCHRPEVPVREARRVDRRVCHGTGRGRSLLGPVARVRRRRSPTPGATGGPAGEGGADARRRRPVALGVAPSASRAPRTRGGGHVGDRADHHGAAPPAPARPKPESAPETLRARTVATAMTPDAAEHPLDRGGEVGAPEAADPLPHHGQGQQGGHRVGDGQGQGQAPHAERVRPGPGPTRR